MVTKLKEMGFMATIGIMLGGNYLSGTLMNTGAFEVYDDLNGSYILFSKLQAGRFPTPEELIRIVANRINF